MEVRSHLFVLVFLISRAATLPFSVRSLKLDGGTNDTIDNIVQSKILGMKEITGSDVEEEDVKFSVFTYESKENLTQSGGNVYFLMHGWTQNAKTCPWYPHLTELLLKMFPSAQVVQVDYGDVVASSYENAVFSSESIGLVITHMIHKMIKEGTSPDKIVLIGHSLGAQVAGWVGKSYRSLMKDTLPKIIAMDPAGPIFVDRPPTRRLNEHDAKVVIVIHSDVKNFGFPTNCGTIDFYPNAGMDQPGCPKLDSLDPSSPQGRDAVWCNHRRAEDIFIASLEKSQHFMATQCGSIEDYKHHKCDENKKIPMGDLKTNERGSFYLNFDEEVPFIRRNEEKIETNA